MAESKDQPQKSETQNEKTEQVAPEKEESAKIELPKKDFFKGENMGQFLDSIERGLEKEQPPKETEKTLVQAKETKPTFRPLKVGGKEIPISSEDELYELAQKGVDYTQKRQRDADWERDLKESHAKLEQVAKPVLEFVEAMKAGKIQLPKSEEETKRDEILEDEDLDPATRKYIKLMDEKIRSLEGKLTRTEEHTQEEALEKAKTTLETFVIEARKEFPFDDIKDNGGNIVTKNLFAGIVSSKVNDDRLKASQDSSFEPRTLQQIIRETAQDMQAIEQFHKGKFSSADKVEITKEKLSSEYPGLIKELVQEGIAEYLGGQKELAPSARSTARDTKPESPAKKEFKGLKHALKSAEEDTELMASLKEFGEQFRRTGGK